jgi:pimeloyl-ACP methyl ester carboxylesterase
MNPIATHKRLQLDHVNLHYLDYGGAGPLAMLLLHGGGAHAHWYDFVGPSLAQHGRVLAVDLRGHGNSTPIDPPVYTYDAYLQDIRALLQAEQITAPLLLGHSMGGILAVKYAGTWPQELQALIVCDSRPRYSPEMANRLRQNGHRQGRVYIDEEDYIAHFRILPDGLRAPVDVYRYIARHAGRQLVDGRWTHKIDRRVYAQREAIDMLPFWKQIICPTLFLYAEHSSRLTPELSENLQDACPHVELAKITDAGHHLMLDQPEQTVALVRKFLQRHRLGKT